MGIKGNEIPAMQENEICEFNKTLLRAEGNQLIEVTESSKKNEKPANLEEYVIKNKWQVFNRITDTFIERHEQDNHMKKIYSGILIGILILQLVVMNVIFIYKGIGALQFSDTTFNLFIAGTIGEVFALITIIVKYLFTDNLTNLLNNILSETKEDTKK